MAKQYVHEETLAYLHGSSGAGVSSWTLHRQAKQSASSESLCIHRARPTYNEELFIRERVETDQQQYDSYETTGSRLQDRALSREKLDLYLHN